MDSLSSQQLSILPPQSSAGVQLQRVRLVDASYDAATLRILEKRYPTALREVWHFILQLLTCMWVVCIFYFVYLEQSRQVEANLETGYTLSHRRLRQMHVFSDAVNGVRALTAAQGQEQKQLSVKF